MIEALQLERLPCLPNGPLAILPGNSSAGGATRKALFVKLLRCYKHGDFFETVGYKVRSLGEAEAYVQGLTERVHEACLLARVYECDQPRMIEVTGTIASHGTKHREVPGLRLIKEFQL